jgi:hypothetical protein
MRSYVFSPNVLVCCVATWTAIIYGVLTRDLVGTALWVTFAFAAVNAERLTAPRDPAEE